LAARKLLGKPRSNSVFPPPIRPALPASTYREAYEISCEGHGKGISRQTFAIVPKIREVDGVMTPQLQRLIFEVQPELCFWKLNDGRSLQHKKTSMEGRKERFELLAPQYPIIGELLARLSRKEAAPHDLLDAAAAAWTAGRLADGLACRAVQLEEVDEKGLLMNIFY
jgi:predicted RNase H-like nuclease